MTREEAKKLINECGLNINEPLHSEVLEIVNEVLTVGEWIPCSERLPEDNDIVLVQLNGKHSDGSKYIDAIYTGCFSDNEQWNVDGEGRIDDAIVVAWMPLPEPYKEKDNE